MERDQLVRKIDQRLQAVDTNIRFRVLSDEVEQEQDWWVVPVIATLGDAEAPRIQTISIYADIEAEFEEEDHLTVLFVPAVA